jgi:hypothetical protein
MDKFDFSVITGYAAKVATVGRCTSQVHIFKGRRAICGYKPAKEMEIQFCANGIEINYVECKSCVKLYRKQQRKKFLTKYTEQKKSNLEACIS